MPFVDVFSFINRSVWQDGVCSVNYHVVTRMVCSASKPLIQMNHSKQNYNPRLQGFRGAATLLRGWNFYPSSALNSTVTLNVLLINARMRLGWHSPFKLDIFADFLVNPDMVVICIARCFDMSWLTYCILFSPVHMSRAVIRPVTSCQ